MKRVPVRETVGEGGLVGVWVTNRGGLRERFEEVVGRWGCVVEAEWVWGKVTERGEWVFDVESKVRRPYEVLLILRRIGGGGGGGEVRRGKGDGEVRRKVEGKVMFAVPDLHSRKPCIKGLVLEGG